MFGNLGLFLSAVADHWIFWIGILLMIEPYAEGIAPRTWGVVRGFLARHPEGRKKIFRIAGLIALFFACFQAWSSQYEARLNAEARRQATAEEIQKLLAMKSLISSGVKEGEDIGKDWVTKDEEAFLHETNRWTNRIGHLIEDAYGKGEASLLMSDAGYISYSDGKKRTDIHNWIIHRLQRLNEIVPRVDSLRMQPNFDPINYHWVQDCSEC
jgi:hypothetical protein